MAKNNNFMSTQPGGEVDSDLFLIGSGMGFYDVEYINKFDNKFLFLASDGLGQNSDSGYFSILTNLTPITKRLFIPCLFNDKSSALANPVFDYNTATQFNAIVTGSINGQKKR